MRRVKVFDFDGTLYRGDSSLDFWLFALRKHKKLAWKAPGVLLYGLLYCLHLVKIEKFKEKFFGFLPEISDVRGLVQDFWQKNDRKLDEELMAKLERGSAGVISASPEFLLKPCFSKYKNVKVIATKVDVKTGMIEGRNCRSEEKIRRFHKVFRKGDVISEFYSDSAKDQPLADLAEKAYIVDKDKVLAWDEEYLWNKKVRKVSWVLFGIFLLVYLVGGVLLSYNYDFKTNLDLLFSSDSARVIDDYSQIVASHYRITVHPLFLLLMQPIVLLIKGATMNEILAIVLFSAVVGALAVLLMYRFIALFQRSTKTCTILSLIYGFSFAALVFNCSIEVYGVAALALIFLWYQVAKVLKHKWGPNTSVWLYVAAVLTLSITITNYVVFLIACLVLLLSKKASFKKLLLINIAAIATVVGLSFYQQVVWHSPAAITDVLTQAEEKETKFVEIQQPLTMIKNVVKNDYYNLFMTSPPVITLNKASDVMDFDGVSLAGKILTSVIYLILVVFIFWHRKKDRLINAGLILTLICFSVLHLVYGNDSTFLYALHFLYLIVGLMGINFVDERKKSYPWFLGFFVLYFVVMLFKNIPAFRVLIGEVAAKINPTFFGGNFDMMGQLMLTMGVIVFVVVFAVIIWRNLRGVVKIKWKQPVPAKKILAMVVAAYAILTMFIAVEAAAHYQEFFWIDTRPIEFGNSEKAEVMTREETFASYKEKIAEYQEKYQEYRENLEEETGDQLPDAVFYVFDEDGQNIVYVNGELKYGETGDTIARLDVIDQVIVPSEKLVIVNTWNEKYIAVQEDESGVHVYMNGKDGVIKDVDVNP